MIDHSLNIVRVELDEYQITYSGCIGISPSWVLIYNMLNFEIYKSIVTNCGAICKNKNEDNEYYYFNNEEDAEKALTMILLTKK